MKISLCTEMVFQGQLLHEILPDVKAAGYEAFEFWGWADKNIALVAEAVEKTGLHVAAFCVKNNNLVNESLRTQYIDGVKETLPIAKQLGCKTLITTVGQRMEDRCDQAQVESIIKGLKAVAPIVEEAGISIVMEPLNILVNHKGYFLDRSDKGFDILKEVNSPCIRLLFDIYHQQITEGNLIQNITENIEWIGHFHAADVPGRNDLGSGEINWLNIKKAIEGTAYQSYFGLEYMPLAEPPEERRLSIQNVRKLLM